MLLVYYCTFVHILHIYLITLQCMFYTYFARVQINACMTVSKFARKIIGTYFLKIVHFHEIISSHLKAGLFWSGSSG